MLLNGGEDHRFDERPLKIRVLGESDVQCPAGQQLGLFARLCREKRPPGPAERGVAHVVDPPVVDLGGKQADPLSVAASNEAAEAAGNQEKVQFHARQPGSAEQDFDAGTNRTGGKLQLPDVPLPEQNGPVPPLGAGSDKELRLSVIAETDSPLQCSGHRRRQLIRRKHPAVRQDEAGSKQLGEKVDKPAAAQPPGLNIADDPTAYVTGENNLLDRPGGGMHAA